MASCKCSFWGLLSSFLIWYFFFFNHPPSTEISTLSLHDALPIWPAGARLPSLLERRLAARNGGQRIGRRDRKSTRLNSSHRTISYAVFCLKKKKITCTITVAWMNVVDTQWVWKHFAVHKELQGTT